MRTNIEIDDELIAEVMAATGLKTKKAVVDRALNDLLREVRQRNALKALRGLGWEATWTPCEPTNHVVVDTSVWINLLRDKDTEAVLRLEHLKSLRQVLVGDIVLLELLQGARSDRHAAEISRQMRQYSIVPMLNEQRAINAASNYRRLREAGVTIRKDANMIIGTYCLDEGHLLLHEDRDFEPIAVHLGLRFA